MKFQILGLAVWFLVTGCSGTPPQPTDDLILPSTTLPTHTTMPTHTTLPATRPSPSDTPEPELPAFRNALAYELPGMGEVSVLSDQYSSAEGSQLSMDLYYPAGDISATGFPVVVFVSGFKAPAADHRDHPAYQSWGRLVAADGMAGVVYETQDPGDLNAVIEHLLDNTDELNIDPENIGLWASSSNAPTALSYAMQDDESVAEFLVVYYGFMLSPDNFQRLDHNNLCSSIGCYGEELKDFEQVRTDLPLLLARAGRDNFRLNKTIDHFLGLVDMDESQVVLIEHADGVHAFDTEQKDERSAEIIELTLQFMRSQFSAEFPWGIYKSGVRVIEFMPVGRYTFGYSENNPQIGADLSVDGQEITFDGYVPLGDSDADPCPHQATYRWILEGELLALEVIGDDPCAERLGGFSLTYRRVR